MKEAHNEEPENPEKSEEAVCARGISFLKISSRLDDRERETATCRWESGTCSAVSRTKE
jgi:hypothetical protein